MLECINQPTASSHRSTVQPPAAFTALSLNPHKPAHLFPPLFFWAAMGPICPQQPPLSLYSSHYVGTQSNQQIIQKHPHSRWDGLSLGAVIQWDNSQKGICLQNRVVYHWANRVFQSAAISSLQCSCPPGGTQPLSDLSQQSFLTELLGTPFITDDITASKAVPFPHLIFYSISCCDQKWD